MSTAVLGTALVFLAAPQGVPAGKPAPPSDARPAALLEVDIEQYLDAQVPLDLAFRDEAGNPVRLGDYFGRKPVVLALVYYQCPMLCTLVLNGLASALSVLRLDAGREFQVVAVSFDPREGPALAAAKKKTYLDRYQRDGAAAGIHFLTGEAAAIEALTRAVGFRYSFDPESGQFAHAAGLTVLTPAGRVSRYLLGVEYAPRDLRLALVEASAGKIGTVVDRVLLFCFRYDPASGKYGAAILAIVRAGGVATVLALAAFIWIMRRRERARTAPPAAPLAARQGGA